MTRIIHTQADLETAVGVLIKQDPRWEPVFAKSGMPAIRRREGGYAGLCSIVCGQQFSTALSAFHTEHPSALVFVSSIPNVYQLWATLHTNRSAASAWRTFGICQSMLAASHTDDVRRAVQAQEVADNGQLRSVCGAVSYCRYDGDAVYNFAFQPSQVSTVDYFHPSIAGQAKLASLTWTASYWG